MMSVVWKKCLDKCNRAHQIEGRVTVVYGAMDNIGRPEITAGITPMAKCCDTI